MTYGYLRVSKDDKELIKQKNLILEHAKNSNIIIDDFIEVQPYSKKTAKQKRIDLLMSRASKSDVLVVTELSRLGRNMLEVLNLIEALKKEDISVIFVKQPELSTTESNPLLQEILRVYGYFAEAERAFISTRTKQGLAAVKAKGIKLGRPKGHKNKERALDSHRDEIMGLLNLGVNLTAIRKIIYQKMTKSLSYSSYKYFIDHDEELLHARHNFDKHSLFH
ncbi:MAG: recombinase family protein [Sulfurimonadaceae bacterium]